jgi:glycine cleavage system aminomethyltransferase T
MLFGRGGFWVDYKLRQGRYDATSEQEDWFNYQVSGPNAVYVVEKASGQSLRDLKFMYSARFTSMAEKFGLCAKAWPVNWGMNCKAS